MTCLPRSTGWSSVALVWFFTATLESGPITHGPFSSLAVCWAVQDRMVAEGRYRDSQVSECRNTRRLPDEPPRLPARGH
jgi:hypothetical protein